MTANEADAQDLVQTTFELALRHVDSLRDRDSAQAWLLRIHGAAAFASLIVLGALLPVHVKRAWRAVKNRRSGAVLLAFVATQVVTGYALYYADEGLRTLAGQIHFALGLTLPALLVIHIVIGRRITGRRARSS